MSHICTPSIVRAWFVCALLKALSCEAMFPWEVRGRDHLCQRIHHLRVHSATCKYQLDHCCGYNTRAVTSYFLHFVHENVTYKFCLEADGPSVCVDTSNEGHMLLQRKHAQLWHVLYVT